MFCSQTSPSNRFLVTVFPSEIEDMMPKQSRVFTGDSLERVTCRPPHGHPEPDVWWEHAGQRVPPTGRVSQNGLHLIFSPTRGEDSGTYTCFAQNKAGLKKQELTVTVASKSQARNALRCECLAKVLQVPVLLLVYARW